MELGTFINGVETTSTNRWRSKNYTKIKPSTTYVSSKNGVALAINWLAYDSSFSYISSGYGSTWTTPQNAEYLRIFGDSSINVTNCLQIEEGTVATPYVKPFKSNKQLEESVSEINENLANTSLYLPTKEITSGNLDNYTEQGIWYISSKNVPNISNVPVTSTMKLTVEKMEKSYSIQVVKNLSYTIYRRYQYWNTSTSSITWSSWKHIDFI